VLEIWLNGGHDKRYMGYREQPGTPCTAARANRRTLTFNPHDISFEKPAGFFKTNHPMLGSQW
jgi:hypothetical protein